MQSVEELYDKWFEEEMKEISEFLIRGGVKEIGEYSYQTGVVRGLTKARAKFNELAEKAAKTG